MDGPCRVEGCPRAPTRRHLCPSHYALELRARHRQGLSVRYRAPGNNAHGGHGSDQDDKVAYLASLTLGEVEAYCTGVLSRASIVGDPDEIETWQELVRLRRKA